MGWRRHSADDAPTAQIDPSPLGTREGAEETGFLQLGGALLVARVAYRRAPHRRPF